MKSNVIVSIENFKLGFKLRKQILHAIRNISLDIYKGESLAIVGESGAGKSVLCKALIGLNDANSFILDGKITYKGKDLTQIRSESEWRAYRGNEIAIVMQDPLTSLNPLIPIGKQIEESVLLHRDITGKAAKKCVLDYLYDVGIPEPEKRYHQYPHEFSGGMRQRVVIAMALACQPQILICDEPTTALDVTVQAQILECIKSLKDKYALTTLYITHDLGVVANVADRIAVMYAGQVVEIGLTEEIFYNAKHPYTVALLESMPQNKHNQRYLKSIKGTPPQLTQTIVGDAFAPRNPHALNIDFIEEPPIFQVSEMHWAKTWLLDPRSKHVAKHIEELDIEQEESKDITASTIVDNSSDPILQVKNLSVFFGSGKKSFQAVKDVSFDIQKGETFGIVGESGSGKTTIGRSILNLDGLVRGEIFFKGKKINTRLTAKERRELTRSIQMIFQDPSASLNERAKINYIVSEGLYNLQGMTDVKRIFKIGQALSSVGLKMEFISRFPHEFSGGQRQRIGIARALVMEPELIIADEPISSLDVSVQAQVLNLLKNLQQQRQLTYLFISHDLSVVRFFCDRVATIYQGQFVEMAPTEILYNRAVHPYTKTLLSASPIPDPKQEKNKTIQIYDANMHAYDIDPPGWYLVEPDHYVWANAAEVENYKKELEK